MQIISIAHSYPREDGDVAGAFIERLNIALHNRNHAVRVIAPADRGEGKRERRHGISVSRVRYAPARFETLAYSGTMVEAARGPLGSVAALSLMMAQAREIRHQCGTGRIDLVHAHWWVPGGVSAWMARRSTRVPYVVTLHGTDVSVMDQSWVGRLLARRVLRGAAAVTAVSSYLADQAAHLAGIDAGRVVIQPMPVDVARFDRTSRGGGGIVTIGRLTQQKNVDIVLEAVAKLKHDGRPIRLRVIGDGPRRQVLEYRARGLGINDLTEFVGMVPPSEIPIVLQTADLMVFPATREGLGLAAAEALMMGVPVVASHAGGGVTDIVPASGAGRLVPKDDVEAMAMAIGELLDDPARMRVAAETGRSLRQRLAPDVVAAVFESVYQSVLGRSVTDNA
jgi:glycosyltransferase involved in cell wall biosynthesis